MVEGTMRATMSPERAPTEQGYGCEKARPEGTSLAEQELDHGQAGAGRNRTRPPWGERKKPSGGVETKIDLQGPFSPVPRVRLSYGLQLYGTG